MSIRPRHCLAGVAIVTVLAVACARTPRATVPRGPVRPSGPPRNGLEVIGWMRATYPSRALRTLAFSVVNTEPDAETPRPRARAYAMLPGRMRVDTLPRSARSGWIRDRQHLSVFRRGNRVLTASRIDLRTLLTLDVFAQSIDTTIMWLDSARVRFALARRAELDGRRVWVVGALEGDTLSTQFWVDAQQWRVVRIIQRDARSPNAISDLRFVDYTEILDVPIPTRVQLWRGGRMIDDARYVEFAVNPSLSSRWFDLTRWRDVRLAD